MRSVTTTVFALLCLTTLSSGCEIDVPEGRYRCDGDEQCPPDLVCDLSRNRCYRDLPARDGGSD